MQETLKNLAKAFVGESQARNRYAIFGKIAQKEGFEQIAAIFLETSDQEKEHAKKLFDALTRLAKTSGETVSEIKIETSVSTDLGNTLENLKTAAAGENHEHQVMYPEFVKIAEEEGLIEIANKMKAIAKAEAHHEERYLKLLKEVEAGTVFKKEQEVSWVCRECGYVHFAKEAPIVCPSCDHAQAFYQIKCENY